MLLLLNESGQTGNRLRSLSNLLALGLETGQSICCPVVPKEFWNYLNMGRNSSLSINVCFKHFGFLSIPIKVICKLGFWRTNTSTSHKLNIFSDWLAFAKPEYTYTHYEEVAEYFSFRKEFYEHCMNLFPKKKNHEELLIAVHMRRQDYRTWWGGKYFFEESVFINQMLSIFQENSNVRFLIFTNEEVDSVAFEEKKLPVQFMSGSAFEDLCMMSMCDYIFGPPSTYSAWAGYIGNKKLVWMKNKNHIYSLSEFQNVPISMSTTKAFWGL